MISFLLTLVSSLADRARGTVKEFPSYAPRTVEKLVYGLVICACFGTTTWWIYPVFAILWAIGSSIGWGEPLGALLVDRKMDVMEYEWWQFGILKKNALLACAFRGLMWGILPAFLAIYNIIYLGCLSMMIIFPLAIIISKKINILKDKWGQQEYIRGFLIGLVALIIGQGL